MKGFLKYLASSVCLIASLQSVSAATLQGVEGSVLVNKGNGFELAGSGTQLQPGDQVLVRAGGKANIVYGEGCASSVSVGTAAVVQSGMPCEAPTTSTSPSVTTLAIGAAVIGGGVALAVGLGSSDGSKKPASP